MEIPNKLKIGGFDYEVIFRDRNQNDGIDIAASHSAWTQKIFLDFTYHKQQQEAAFLHEILEALNKHGEWDLEHCTITALANNFYQVLKDNDLLK